MKRILLFIMGLSLYFVSEAQSDSLKAAYRQVVTTLKEYKLKSQDASDGSGITKSISLSIHNGRLVFTIVDDFSPFNDPLFGHRPGTKKLYIPVEDMEFSQAYYSGPLRIASKNGFEFIYKGKKELLEEYKFYGESLTVKKLNNELNALKNILIRDEFKGSLGAGGNTATKKNVKTSTHSPSNTNGQSQPKQRKRIPSGK